MIDNILLESSGSVAVRCYDKQTDCVFIGPDDVLHLSDFCISVDGKFVIGFLLIADALVFYFSMLISVVNFKTAVSPLLTHWRYCSLSLNHRYKWERPGWAHVFRYADSRWLLKSKLPRSHGCHFLWCLCYARKNAPWRWCVTLVIIGCTQIV